VLGGEHELDAVLPVDHDVRHLVVEPVGGFRVEIDRVLRSSMT
jgi:hypothetical protein